MQLTKYFNTLLRDTVNLPKGRLDELAGRVESIYTVLKNDDVLSELVTGKTPQGSWAHRTIIKPEPGKEYDADVLIHMDENPGWADNRGRYIGELYSALGRGGYEDRHRMTRCVRVQYANDCHVDLVPYVQTASGQRIVNRKTGEWEDTNPEGFTAWMAERDRITHGNFRKVVRLMKYLRDHRKSFTGTRSIILMTLLGNRVDTWAEIQSPDAYKTVPKTLVTLVEALDAWMQAQYTMPDVEDPSSPGTLFNHRWSPESYEYFKKRINAHAKEMRNALDDTDPAASAEQWQALFGDGFKTDAAKTESASPFLLGGGAASLGASSGRSGRAG
ncbi:hypothetical protein A9R04_20535 [Nocardiopsis dassonvillei]|uniref:SMODS domain-containing nucleotidyltransferase n=1 Tax=Nocardiopsis dassonvillei TaxID=2014 RepID=UPI0008FC5803|nr:nucleotidyltransferase [Nocardiopsis dassonvillei]APC36913.1 hypothetical protein A9R04_20535 [Nocardiopsis dassonvillei]